VYFLHLSVILFHFTHRIFTFIDVKKSATYHNSQVCFTVEVFAVIGSYMAYFGSYLTIFRDGL